MSLATARASFIADLLNLWETDYSEDHLATCDLIETYWKNARVTGFEATVAPQFATGITYGSMSVLSIPGGTAASAAAAIESALTTMCAASIFTVIPPATVTPPPLPIPGGPATPGLLTPLLSGFFTAGVVGGSTAVSIANAIGNFLSGWQVNAVIPPAASAPVPIL